MSDDGYTYYDQMEQNSRSVSIEQLKEKKRDKLMERQHDRKWRISIMSTRWSK